MKMPKTSIQQVAKRQTINVLVFITVIVAINVCNFFVWPDVIGCPRGSEVFESMASFAFPLLALTGMLLGIPLLVLLVLACAEEAGRVK